MSNAETAELTRELGELLKLGSNPFGIFFTDSAPEGIPAFEAAMPAATEDGRTGKVPASCVFWMEAPEQAFTTVAADHDNCSVGSMTHGFKSLEEVAHHSDVAALLESGWVTMDDVPNITVVSKGTENISYGPVDAFDINPDVIFFRLNAKQLMILSDALTDLHIEGKPQCHIIGMAKEQNKVAASVGCMLSRVRTGMSNNDMSCAVPVERLGWVVHRVRETCKADYTVAEYASEDAKRFE